MNSPDDTKQLIHLESEKECRFVVDDPGEKVILRMTEGSAELFGTELNINKDYEFSYFSAITIFTWFGCTLQFCSTSSNIRYRIKSSKETLRMRNLHDYLQNIRNESEINNIKCPITLIVGPTDVGKSTLCRFLLNYAARYGKKPIFIDLDVGQSSLSITGTFGVLPISEPCDVNGNFSERALSVYYFGYISPGHNMLLYKLLLKKLSRALNARLNSTLNDIGNSGVVIDTCGWVDGEGYKLITQIIRTLEVNTVFVVGENSLYSRLSRELHKNIDISFVTGFKSAILRNRTVRRDKRNSSINEYFYGSSKVLHPYIIKVNFSDLQIFKAKSSSELRSRHFIYDDTNLTSVNVEPDILYHVLGLSYAEQIKDILLSSVFGFTCIIDINMDSQVATLLSPHPSPLPSKYFVIGDITFIPQEINV